MADLQGALPIPGIVAAVARRSGVSLAMIEPAVGGCCGCGAELPDRRPGAGSESAAQGCSLGSPRSSRRIWRDEVAWGVGRLAHTIRTARPVVRDGEAWWICKRRNERLYRIGRGDVPIHLRSAPTWAPGSHRARKRRQGPSHNR